MICRRLLPLLALLLWPSSAFSCNIPVFRYALERWRAEREEDLYRVVVFSHGPLSAEHQASLAPLRKLSDAEGRKANLVLDVIDVSGKMDADVRKLWEAQKNPPLPWVVLRYPGSDDKTPSPWSGPLSVEAVRRLTESPARQEIARRILKGESVVWVMLESGEKNEDDAAAKLLTGELAKLEKQIELPEGLGEGSVKLLSELPVRIAFSLIRVSRTNPEDQVFVAMLLHSEEDLAKENGPMAFPFFGRGRALEGLLGKGINADNIEGMSRFLCGACSCQVKRLNPGFDLLFATDWDSILENPDEKTSEPPSREGVPVPIPPGTSSTGVLHLANSPPPRNELSWLMWVGLGTLILVLVWWCLPRPRMPLGGT